MVTDPPLAGSDPIAQIRAFNRFWTRQIGLLQAGLLDTPYSLTEARVIFELAQRDHSDLRQLVETLDLDAGYLSRVLSKLRSGGLVQAGPDERDGRRQHLSLTAAGSEAFRLLDRRSAADVQAMLDELTGEERRRLVAAVRAIRQLLDPDQPPPGVVIRPPHPGDLGWIVQRHGSLYADEYGWNETFEGLVARVIADYVDGHDPRRESAWIAEMDGTNVGSVLCCQRDEDTAQLRLLLVDPQARGRGLGSQLVRECIGFATRARYRRLILWTNDVLVSARRIYEAAGFQLVDEEPHHSFGHELVGQHWSLELRTTSR